MKKLKKYLCGIIKEDRMDKEQRNNKSLMIQTCCGSLANQRVNSPRLARVPQQPGIIEPITVPIRAVRYTANLPSSHTGELQGQMNKWIVFVLAASASFMTTLDGSIVNIGLPSIARTFHTGVSGATEWIIIGYLVVIAAVLLTCGRLADMLGRKPIFLM